MFSKYPSKNYYSADLTRYYTSDPYRIAFLWHKGCTKGNVNGNDPDSIVFELIAGSTPIPKLIEELSEHPVIEYHDFVQKYKMVMAEIRDIKALKKEKAGQ